MQNREIAYKRVACDWNAIIARLLSVTLLNGSYNKRKSGVIYYSVINIYACIVVIGCLIAITREPYVVCITLSICVYVDDFYP